MKLAQLIKKKKATVGVVGLGYVGLPTAVAIAQAGFKVIGFDIDRKKVKAINAGQSFIEDVSGQTLKATKNLKATSDWQAIKKCQVVLITVPTPLTLHKTPDLSYMENAAKKIAKYLRPESLVILESTTYPGTTEELLRPLLSRCHLAFSPERIDPGNKQFALKDIAKVVGGIDKKSLQLAVLFYKQYLKKVLSVSSTKAAEMTKLLENIFRLVNISLINELKLFCDRAGIDIYEVIEAAKTKPFGFMPFYPGPGVGGSCIPQDPFYFSWKAREIGFYPRFIELAGEINDLMPHYTVIRITRALNDQKRALNGAKILVLGAAYKKDIADYRESPALAVIKELLHKQALVSYNDPHLPEIILDHQSLKSLPLTDRLLQSSDCVVILTDHSAYDYDRILRQARLIVDTRNAIKEKSAKVFK